MKTYNLKGIKFTKAEVFSVTMAEMSEMKISPGHFIYFLEDIDKPIYMRGPGDKISKEYVQTYIDRGATHFHLLLEVDESFLKDLKSIFISFKRNKTELDNFHSRDKLISIIKDSYIDTEETYSILNLIKACFDVFYHLPEEVIQKLYDADEVLYHRSLMNASYSVITAIFMGYLDFYTLQDIFNSTVIMDLGLVGPDLNFEMVQACEKEREKIRGGVEYLELYKPSSVTAFMDHPSSSYEIAKKYEKYFYSFAVCELILHQHESANGAGFPNGVNYLGLHDFEVIAQYVDLSIPFRKPSFKNSDGARVFENWLSAMKNEESINRVGSQRIALMFNHVFNMQFKKSEPIPVSKDIENNIVDEMTNDINEIDIGDELVG
jgi:hypothetical protein